MARGRRGRTSPAQEVTPNLTTLYLMSSWNLAEQRSMLVEVPAGATAGGLSGSGRSAIPVRLARTVAVVVSNLIIPPGSDIHQTSGYIDQQPSVVRGAGSRP